MKIKALIIFAALLFFCSAAYAVPGDADPTFNESGRVSFRYGLGVDQVFEALNLLDGKTIVAGRAFFADTSRGVLVKYNSDGTTDNNFGIGGKFVWDVDQFINFNSAAAAQDGKIIVLGDYAVGRVNADGTPDTGFGIGGIAPLPPGAFYKVRVQPDGKILAGGVYQNGRAVKIIFVRLNADGSLDQSFGTGGIAALENRGAVEIFSDFEIDQSGGIVVTGQFKPKYDPAFTYATLVARFTPGGIVDTSFGQNGRLIFAPEKGGIGTRIAVQNDGKIVVGGLSSPNYPNGQRPFIMRCNANGSLDVSFNGTGYMLFESSQLAQIRQIFPQPNGKILAVGYTPDLDSAVLRVHAGGGLDITYGSRGMRPVPGFYVVAAALHSDGRLVLSSQDGGDINLVTVDSAGALEMEFGVGGRVVTDVGERKAFNAELLIQPDGKSISIGGGSIGLTNKVGIGVARYNVDGTPDRSFAGDGNMALPGCVFGQRRTGALQGTKIVIGCGDNFNHFLTRIDSDGSLDTTFGAGGVSRIYLGEDEPIRIAVLPDGKILSYSSNNSYTGTGSLYRFEADGALDNTFGNGGHVTTALPAGQKTIGALILQPDGKFLVGGYYRVTGPEHAQILLARFNADGSADLSFGANGVVLASSGPGVSDLGYVFLLGSDGRVTVAGDRSGGGEFDYIEAARFMPNGQIDTAFGNGGFVLLKREPNNPQDVGKTHSAAMQSDGKLVVYCYSTSLNGDATVRIDTDGNVDTGWGTGGWSALATNVFAGLAVQAQSSMQIGPDGKMVLVSSDNNLIVMRRLLTDENLSEMVKR